MAGKMEDLTAHGILPPFLHHSTLSVMLQVVVLAVSHYVRTGSIPVGSTQRSSWFEFPSQIALLLFERSREEPCISQHIYNGMNWNQYL